MNNLTIINQNGTFTIDSREVAEMTEVRHSDLLEKINGYVQHLTNGKFRSSDFFVPNTYVGGNGEERPCYLLTRKGCDMVANKMTGEKGVLFTAAYVTKFEEMERAQNKPFPIDSKFLFQIAAQLEEKERQIALMQPKADYFDNLVDKNLLTNFRNTAKELKVKESTFIEWLLDNEYIYRDSKDKLKPYAKFTPDLFEIKEFVSPKNGYSDVQTMITPKGRETFRLLIKN